MSPVEIERAVRLRLAARIADDCAALDGLAGAVGRLTAPAGDERGEWMRALALAFEVERYYTAIESLLARVVRRIDGDVPSGAGGHQELLRAAAVAIDGVRPAIVAPELLEDLRELLKFRHLARHGYDNEPTLPRMSEQAARVQRVHPALVVSLRGFEAWLRSG